MVRQPNPDRAELAKLTQRQLSLMLRHFDRLIGQAERAVSRYKSSTLFRDDPAIAEAVVYWSHVVSGLRWGRGQLIQRSRGPKATWKKVTDASQ